MALKIPGYLRTAYKASTKAGWDWSYRGTKHILITTPEGMHVTCISLTAYDGTITKRVTSKLRRANCPGI